MIATGIFLCFLSWLLNEYNQKTNFTKKREAVEYILSCLGSCGLILIFAGIVTFFWRYLP